MPILNCDAYGFANRLGTNGTHQLYVSWEQIVHAAITVGRRGWRDVFRHGQHSLFEMFYRSCMIYANLQSSHSNHIVKTSAYRSLDPSEKSAISYFLGLTFTKLMATIFFGIPWLLHLDVYKNQLSILTRRRRPDLVGQDSWGGWSVFEAKGRTNGKDPDVVARAKAQTRGLRRIGSYYPIRRVASIIHFPRQSLRVYMEDPDDTDENAVDLNISEDQFHHDYYRPITDLIGADWRNLVGPAMSRRIKIVDEAGIERIIHAVELQGTDVEIGLENQVLVALRSKNIRSQIINNLPPISEPLAHFDTEHFRGQYTEPDELTITGENNWFLGPDGVFVRLGESWARSRMRLDPRERRG